jgi:CheY-like chemotaxis protein
LKETVDMATETASPTQALMQCFHCNNAFDLLEVDPCHCLVRERTVMCPSCDRCFCTAPQDYKHEFLRIAPTGLLNRRLAELRNDSSPAHAATTVVGPDNAPLVLVVDDSRTVRMIAARTIAQMGYRTIEAENAEDALAATREHRPAAILTDALMPRLDGREFCRMIKSDPELSNTVVILMTALYKDRRYKIEALSHFRADHYLTKPVPPEELKQVLRKHLGQPAPLAQSA